MARRITDADLRIWEVFLNPVAHGDGESVRLVFRCLSDRTLPSRGSGPRALEEGVDLLAGPVPELQELLAEARPLS